MKTLSQTRPKTKKTGVEASVWLRLQRTNQKQRSAQRTLKASAISKEPRITKHEERFFVSAALVAGHPFSQQLD